MNPNALFAVVVFAFALAAVGAFFVRWGKFGFWKVAAKFPDEALAWFQTDSAWMIVEDGAVPPTGYVGPFRHYAPTVGRAVTVYGREDSLEESQQRFVAKVRLQEPPDRFPLFSGIALLIPVVAMLSVPSVPSDAVPLLTIVAYGVEALAYVLVFAAIVAGHFRILGLHNRFITLVAAVLFWGSHWLLQSQLRSKLPEQPILGSYDERLKLFRDQVAGRELEVLACVGSEKDER